MRFVLMTLDTVELCGCCRTAVPREEGKPRVGPLLPRRREGMAEVASIVVEVMEEDI